jgi:hypothetical protein
MDALEEDLAGRPSHDHRRPSAKKLEPEFWQSSLQADTDSNLPA